MTLPNLSNSSGDAETKRLVQNDLETFEHSRLKQGLIGIGNWRHLKVVELWIIGLASKFVGDLFCTFCAWIVLTKFASPVAFLSISFKRISMLERSFKLKLKSNHPEEEVCTFFMKLNIESKVTWKSTWYQKIRKKKKNDLKWKFEVNWFEQTWVWKPTST